MESHHPPTVHGIVVTTRLHTIQYLRAIAAVLVLVSHALLYPMVEQTLAYGRIGWLGVILFFVVSGFIMVAVTGAGRFDPLGFLRRRVIRVVPLYWAFTLLAALLALILPGLFKTTIFDGMQLLLSMAFIPFYNPASHGLHPLYKLGWTLNYEMFFYLCFALLAPLAARGRVVVLTLAYLALAVSGTLLHPQTPIAAFYTSYMPLAFVAGAWLGLAHVEGRLGGIGRRIAVPLALVGLAGAIEGFALDRGAVEDGTAFLGLLTFSTAAVALAVGFEPKLPRLVMLERLGDASYSVYLAHIFAVAGFAGMALRFVGQEDGLAVSGAIAVAVIGGIALGLMLYETVEKPMMRRLRRPI